MSNMRFNLYRNDSDELAEILTTQELIDKIDYLGAVSFNELYSAEPAIEIITECPPIDETVQKYLENAKCSHPDKDNKNHVHTHSCVN